MKISRGNHSTKQREQKKIPTLTEMFQGEQTSFKSTEGFDYLLRKHLFIGTEVPIYVCVCIHVNLDIEVRDSERLKTGRQERRDRGYRVHCSEIGVVTSVQE